MLKLSCGVRKMEFGIIGEKLSARVDSCGARLVSLTKGGVEYIWQRDPQYWSDCAPILFPVIAQVKDGTITVDGKDYPMTKHGFVRNAEFDMVKQTKSMITFKYSDNEETRKMYPWNFDFYVTFAVENDKTVCVTFEVVNNSATDMLFCLGGHPAINVPLTDGKFEDYVVEFEQPETLYTDYTNDDGSISADKKDLIVDNTRFLPLKRGLFNNDALIFENVKSNSLKLKNQFSDEGVEFNFGDFPTLAIWSKGEPLDAGYVCIEPWFGMGWRDNESTELSEKYGVQTLRPGAQFTASFSITTL